MYTVSIVNNKGEMKMAKQTTTQYALTHVKAYIMELIQHEEFALHWMSPDYKAKCQKHLDTEKQKKYYYEDLQVAYFVDEYIRDAKTFAEVKKILTDIYGRGPNTPERGYTNKIFPLITDFYKAMKKVVPVIDYKEHSGTECRGWWRVLEAINGTSKYFCSGDLGRDAYMAQEFYEQGAITQQQYKNHITKRTFDILSSDRFQNEAGQPDYNKIVNFWKEDYVEQELDMRFVNVLKEAA